MIKKKKGKCAHRSLNIAPFLDNKIVCFLKTDKKKIQKGDSEFNGRLNNYVISLLRRDLKERNIL